MHLSRHAEIRGQQRGISNAHLKLLAAFGHTERRPGNATALFMDKKGIRELEQVLREGLQALDKLRGQVVLLAADSTVITCYHQTKKIRS